ncbi:hypothetical protein BB559_004088 [Furculomyces boomerangus]|uniref:Cleft lip and palate transmembrane protein 1 n=2 Tax=Harpellales TaxID=61421 RepID=A0A2T9YGM8_9FUNG|nr:hypothetical protein BB559_004088 [Furculomyces boomerangus]PVZ97418.1 hypothetical protein BB558_006588 [Smittium angustum]
MPSLNISNIITYCTYAFGLWYLSRIFSIGVQLYYPSLHIPLINETPKQIRSLPKHDLAWKKTHNYLVSLYTSKSEKISGIEFFETSDLVYRSQVFVPGDGRFLYENIESNNKPKKISNGLDLNINITLPSDFYQKNENSMYLYAIIHQKENIVENIDNTSSAVDVFDPLVLVTSSKLVLSRERTKDTKVQLLDEKAMNEKRVVEPQQVFHEPHAKTRVTLELVLERHRFPSWRFPSDIAPYIRVVRGSGKTPDYLPLFWENPLSTRSIHLKPLANYTKVAHKRIEGESMGSFETNVKINVVQLGWFRLCLMLTKTLAQFESPDSLIKASSEEIDNLKEMVYENDSRILLLTIIASVLHLIFEFLAYKEDISFWSQESKNDKQPEKLDDLKNSMSTDPKIIPNSSNENWKGISRSGVAMRTISSVVGTLRGNRSVEIW